MNLNDGMNPGGNERPFRPSGPIIKWYNVKMTYEEKFKFGHLTYPEYLAWMEELAAKEKAENGESDTAAQTEGTTEAQTESTGHTFWANDAGERTNVSSDEYAEFLSKNNVDVTNHNTVDIQALLNETNGVDNSEAEAAPEPAPQNAEADLDEVLKNVNKDIHGDNYLTQEEIEALFAAANGG